MQEMRVLVRARAAEHPDRLRGARGVVRGVLKRFPSALEEHPLLRIQDLRLARVVAEEGGVEVVRVREHAARADVSRAHQHVGAYPGIDELFVGEGRERFDAVSQVAPEPVEVAGTGNRPAIPTIAISRPVRPSDCGASLPPGSVVSWTWSRSCTVNRESAALTLIHPAISPGLPIADEGGACTRRVTVHGVP